MTDFRTRIATNIDIVEDDDLQERYRYLHGVLLGDDDCDFKRPRFLNYIADKIVIINHVKLPSASNDGKLLLEGFKKYVLNTLEDVRRNQELASEYIPELRKEVDEAILAFCANVKTILSSIAQTNLPNSISLSAAYIVNDYTDKLNKFIDSSYISKDMIAELTSMAQRLTDTVKDSHPDTVDRIKELFDETDKKISTYCSTLRTHQPGDFDIDDVATFDTSEDLKAFITRCMVMVEGNMRAFRSNYIGNVSLPDKYDRTAAIISSCKRAMKKLQDLYLTIPDESLTPELQRDRWYTATGIMDCIIRSLTVRI